MKKLISAVLGLLLAFGSASSVLAAENSRIPPMDLYQTMLEANKQQGWVVFRNYGGRQLIYFTALQTLHCRLKEIRYSINSDALDQQFELVKCNPQLPFSLPSDSGPEDILISLEEGTARTVTVQVTWEDDSKSEIMTYEPCKDVGDQTCGWPVN